ncbi:MAG: UDP-N-acetylglucosamine 2-epimerase (non-hydrolyzing) [Thermodesulfobacteriota bacterium]|nr:UDP-N-acetylglucosamine 2-epimerase (non-hydrolyzing) [Thermodesulfobacteriota bacterium]
MKPIYPTKPTIHLVCAARPNFMKIAPLYHALKKEAMAVPILVHTGQHYDLDMSDVFFKDLRLPEPDIHLGVGSGTHAEQTGHVMIAYEKELLRRKPDLVVVPGDVNSTMAATLAAVKLGIKTAHLEAGLRSFDRTMPEEINRLVTDALADILWTPSHDADENLSREGISSDKIHRVGNIMIDSLEMLRDKIEKPSFYRDLGLKNKEYGVVTVHRPSNVDNPEILAQFCSTLVGLAKRIPLLFSVHPRTRKNLQEYGFINLLENAQGLFIAEPMNYIRFMSFVFNCRVVITDSGGMQEETTYLGIPCLTLRPNTERPITITHGTNQLCDLQHLKEKLEEVLSGKTGSKKPIEFWDGATANRIVASIKTLLHNKSKSQKD